MAGKPTKITGVLINRGKNKDLIRRVTNVGLNPPTPACAPPLLNALPGQPAPSSSFLVRHEEQRAAAVPVYRIQFASRGSARPRQVPFQAAKSRRSSLLCLALAHVVDVLLPLMM